MPYVNEVERELIEEGESPETAGQLNYQISALLGAYLAERAEDDGRMSYGRLNEVIGVLECAKLEFYRRLVAFYEDKKMDDNGDVYSDEVLELCYVGESL